MSEAVKRRPEEEVFGKVFPTQPTLTEIQRIESNGWVLVATRSTQDEGAPKFHQTLQQFAEVHHQQLNGFIGGASIGLNCYFFKRPAS